MTGEECKVQCLSTYYRLPIHDFGNFAGLSLTACISLSSLLRHKVNVLVYWNLSHPLDSVPFSAGGLSPAGGLGAGEAESKPSTYRYN